MSLEILKEIMQDADVFGFIKAGSYADTYDREATFILDYLSKDLSIEQIQNVIWHAFYENCCVCHNNLTGEPWILDINQAMLIIGDPDKFKDLAYMIRHSILSL